MEQIENSLYPAKAHLASMEDEKKYNPAFRFFGKRLMASQSLPEFLNELLLVFFSPKQLAEHPEMSIQGCFPSREILTDCKDGPCLLYAPSTRLNLKLFAFFGASRLDARHKVHREHFEFLQDLLHTHIKTDSDQDKTVIIHDLENLFLGLRSAGEDRTWCAQQFLPLCQNLLSSETIWNVKEAIRKPPQDWTESIRTISKYWSINRHRFMARGGEVLYYQLCLALSKEKETISKWNEEAALGLGPEEEDPKILQISLEHALQGMLDKSTGLDALAALIVNLEKETAAKIDQKDDGLRYQSMGWCSAASWREGYLFAVELLRILRADVDIMDRLTLLETACGLQVLRTLLARTAKLSNSPLLWPGYILPITASEEKSFTLRAVSQHAYKYIRTMLERLILDPELPILYHSIPTLSATPQSIVI